MVARREGGQRGRRKEGEGKEEGEGRKVEGGWCREKGGRREEGGGKREGGGGTRKGEREREERWMGRREEEEMRKRRDGGRREEGGRGTEEGGERGKKREEGTRGREDKLTCAITSEFSLPQEHCRMYIQGKQCNYNSATNTAGWQRNGNCNPSPTSVGGLTHILEIITSAHALF